jgi:uncharacterized protein (TIGR02996 family)
VTTEDDFQLAIDADPEDCQLRMVFADWLDEQVPPDPRAEGYRALGRLGLWAYEWSKVLAVIAPRSYPQGIYGKEERWAFHNGEGMNGGYGNDYAVPDCHVLPPKWLRAVNVAQQNSYLDDIWTHLDCSTRRAVEDVAARVYRPEFVFAELLSPPVPA